MNKFVIAGTSSNVGKTTLTIGILKALVNKGLKVNSFKCGPDYIDPMFHSFITGKKSINLDLYLMNEESVKYTFINHSVGDISVIEGVMGLYDGVKKDFKEISSTAKVAKTINAPVVLVIDGSGVSTSAAAEVLGFKNFDKDLNIKGVIVNKIHGENHYNLIKDSVEKYTGIECLGYLKYNKDIAIESQHLGLIPSNEIEVLNVKIDILVKSIEETIDIDRLIELSNVEDTLTSNYKIEHKNYNLKIAIANDKAFNFYYEDNLEYFKNNGIELIDFSPINDKNLPKEISGIYLGGGFPEKFAKELSDNKSMLQDIKKFANNFGMIYGECGGLMYLGNCIYDFNKKRHKMVSVFDLETEMTEKLQRFGYIEVNYNNMLFRAHEFHRSKIINDKNVKKSYLINRFTNKSKVYKGGFTYKNVLAGYPHVHFYSNLEFANQLIKKMKEFKGDINE